MVVELSNHHWNPSSGGDYIWGGQLSHCQANWISYTHTREKTQHKRRGKDKHRVTECLTYGGKVGANGPLLRTEPEGGQFGGRVEEEGLGTGREELADHGHHEPTPGEDGGADDGVEGAEVTEDGAEQVQPSSEVELGGGWGMGEKREGALLKK